jgi:sulfatase modifying factor 1
MRARTVAAIFTVSSFLALTASSVPAATEFQCGPGGKPNASKKKCDCPADKVEQTDAKGTSRCVARPPAPPLPKPTTSPTTKPTTSSTTSSTTKPTTTAPTSTPTIVPTATSFPSPPPLPTPSVIATPTTTLTKTPLPVPTVIAKPTPGAFACPAGMLIVTGGTFSPTPHSSSDPKTRTIVSFCLDATEVTVDAYAKCVASKKCGLPYRAFDAASAPFCNWGHPKGRANHPINCVVLDQADAFCKAAGKRLPFAEEWEWAARGGAKATKFAWGNPEPSPSLLNACAGECPPNFAIKTSGSIKPMYLGADAFPETAPVGSFPAGNFGLFDMAGNVGELTRRMGQTNAIEVWGGGFLSNDFDEVATTSRSYDTGNSQTGFRCALIPELE